VQSPQHVLPTCDALELRQHSGQGVMRGDGRRHAAVGRLGCRSQCLLQLGHLGLSLSAGRLGRAARSRLVISPGTVLLALCHGDGLVVHGLLEGSLELVGGLRSVTVSGRLGLVSSSSSAVGRVLGRQPLPFQGSQLAFHGIKPGPPGSELCRHLVDLVLLCRGLGGFALILSHTQGTG
jgi:hypothetical protein